MICYSAAHLVAHIAERRRQQETYEAHDKRLVEARKRQRKREEKEKNNVQG
jgi:hypothetical protein